MDKPNIIVILSDDQGYWAMGCTGNNEIRTPNLDKLAKQGTRFDNLFCVSPVCSPARASLLTGKIPSQHGVHDWIKYGNSPVGDDKKLIEYLKEHTGYTDILSKSGYICGISGKWHLGNSILKQKGFSYWEVHAQGGGSYYNAPMIKEGKVHNEPGYVTDVITDNALKFLDNQKKSPNPFYLSVHYTAPHAPWNRENHPKDIFDDYYKNCDFKSIPKEPTHPWHVKVFNNLNDEQRRICLSGYFTAVTAMDLNIGRVLKKVDEMGIRNNTLIFFTGDNGMNMGHHGIIGKGNGTYPMNMYDTSVKVPSIISMPGIIPEDIVNENLLSHYDFMPTLLDFLGIDNSSCDNLPGKSFINQIIPEVSPYSRGQVCRESKKNNVNDSIVVFDEYGPVRMIRTKEWKYVHRYPDGPNELFDLVNDSEEKNNLYKENNEKVIELKSQLNDWFKKYADPAVDGANEHVTGCGQLGLAGFKSKGEKAFKDKGFK